MSGVLTQTDLQAATSSAVSADASSGNRAAGTWPQKFDVLGIGVSATDYDTCTRLILASAEQRQPALVVCQAVHGVVTASGDAEYRAQLNQFDIVAPDGQPVRWALNLLHGVGLQNRVYGPELMLRLCAAAAEQQVGIYLYGGSPSTVELLRDNLLQKFPALRIVGYESPPYRSLTASEDREVVERIERSGAGLLFIGLGCPKQDQFAFAHRESIRAVQLCVGAAFDFHAGVKKTAPAWMQQRGLEWLYRLLQEPRRLGRRYLETNSLFVIRLARQYLKMKIGGKINDSSSSATVEAAQ